MKIAVIIPCLNEELTVATVVHEALRYLPQAKVYVFDNGSADATAELARNAGATVIYSPLKGKGAVLRQAFRLLDADYLIMTDGDCTYPMSEAPRLIQLAQNFNYEMVMGARLQLGKPEAFRPLHYFGNKLFTRTVQLLFGHPVQDLLTGFRVFSRRFTQEVELQSDGFEIETELTIRAMAQHLAFREVPIPYSDRPTGSHSKLRTFRDGVKIVGAIIKFVRVFRPLMFFLSAAAASLALSCLTPDPFQQYFSTLSVALIAIGFLLDNQLNLKSLRVNRRTSLQKSDQSHQDNLKRSA